MKKFYNFINFLRHAQKGQSLVETAIIAPIALIMLIGVFEVGWSLRGYLVLVNANREATRFAIRPQYLDFSQRDVNLVGYETVLTHTQTTIANQVDVDFEKDAKFIITHLVVDTGWPCNPIDWDPAKDGQKGKYTCNCDDFVDASKNYNAAQVYTLDDKIISPDTPGFDYYAYAQPTSALSDTKIIYAEEIAELTHKNNQLNCELLKKGGTPSDNNVLITEVFYNQPQLFGFPFISNPYTDPVPLYSHTAMRLARGSRGSLDNDEETIGPVCNAMPFIVKKDTIDWPTDNKLNERVDILDGVDGSDFGFLAWNPDNTNDAVYLQNELLSSNVPLNDFVNAHDPSDTILSVGDWVASLEGTNSKVDDEVAALVGQRIRIPVWDPAQPNGGYKAGAGKKPDAYRVVGFAWVRIEAVSNGSIIDTSGPNKKIFATYLGDATNETCATSS